MSTLRQSCFGTRENRRAYREADAVFELFRCGIDFACIDRLGNAVMPIESGAMKNGSGQRPDGPEDHR
jgi:hypothetical protein